AEPRAVAEVDHGGVTAGGVDEVEVGEGERCGRVAVAPDEFLQRVEGALGQLVEAADQFGAVLGELRLAVGQYFGGRDPADVPLQQLDFLLAAGDQVGVALPEAVDG